MTATSPTPAVSEHACASCGKDAEHDFGDLWLCSDCYHTAGSTCAGVRIPTGRANAARPGRADDTPSEGDGGTVC